jgi:hypothetical protein
MKKSSSKKISKSKPKDFTPLALENLPLDDKQFDADGFKGKNK